MGLRLSRVCEVHGVMTLQGVYGTWGHDSFHTEDGELRRTLQSLAIGNARVLIKHPKVRDGYTTVGGCTAGSAMGTQP